MKVTELARDHVYAVIPERARYLAHMGLHKAGVKDAWHNPDAITAFDFYIDNICNRTCGCCNLSFAPNLHNNRSTALAMPRETWIKGLTTLGRIGYYGDLQAVGLNEPLLTADRTFQFYDDAVKIVPQAKLKMFTNGDLLYKFVDQIAARDLEVHVGIHHPVNKKALDFLESDEAKKLRITCINDTRYKRLEIRGPETPKEQVAYPDTCWNYIMRRRNLVIVDPRGQVLCCPHQTHQEHKESRTWGDINETDFWEIYQKFEFWQFREQRRLGLTTGMRQMCRDCTGR